MFFGSTCVRNRSFVQAIDPLRSDALREGWRTFSLSVCARIGQGEKRLHALRSVGIGGHISTEDTSGSDLYRTGMARELDEEVIADESVDAPIVGLIYDPSNDVGKVHLGVVHLMTLSGPTVRAREEDLLDAGFMPLQQILAEQDRLETWSRLCVQALFV